MHWVTAAGPDPDPGPGCRSCPDLSLNHPLLSRHSCRTGMIQGRPLARRHLAPAEAADGKHDSDVVQLRVGAGGHMMEHLEHITVLRCNYNVS